MRIKISSTPQNTSIGELQYHYGSTAVPLRKYCSTATRVLAACHVACRACLVCLCLLVMALSMAGCSVVDNSQVTDNPTGPMPARAISWSIQQKGASATRALIDDEALRLACTPNVYGNHERIGVWGQYSTAEDGQQRTYSVFNATPLT